MKKIIISLFTFLLLPICVKAGSVSISIDGPSSVYVGDTVKISVTLSSSNSLGSWNYNISYDDSKLSYVSTTANAAQSVADYVSGDGKKSVSYSWTYKATTAGTVTFSVSGIDVYAFDESQLTVTGSTKKTIEVKKPNSVSNGGSNKPSTNYNYSTNNNLNSLSVEGFEFEFDKTKTEYSVSVPSDVTSVKVGATAEDGKARVKGIGDFEVKEGDNIIEVVVTAENGDKKTYKLNIVVAEATPIEVKIGEDTYSVVRKADLLPGALATFEASTTLIKGEEIPCYHSSITDFYLVGLRDSEGNIGLYRYDAKEDKFYNYNQLQIGGIYIALLDGNVPDGYKMGSVKINEKDYSAFVKNGSYPILYGANLETGEKNYYSYDSSEGTIQKYIISTSTKGIDSFYIIIGLGAFALLELFIILLQYVRYNKVKKILSKKMNLNNSSEKTLVKEPVEKKVEESVPKPIEKSKKEKVKKEKTKGKKGKFGRKSLSDTGYIAKGVSQVFESSIKEEHLVKEKDDEDDGMYHF